MASLAKKVAARTAAVEHAFNTVLLPVLSEASGSEEEAAPVVEYLASMFAEEARLALGEEEVEEVPCDGDAASAEDAGASRKALSKAERHARNKALKKKGGRRKAMGEGTFHVQRSMQLSYEQGKEVLDTLVPDALDEAGCDDSVEEVVEAVLTALFTAGAVRDVDDDAFDLITDVSPSDRKVEEQEVTVGASCLAVLEEDEEWHEAKVRDIDADAGTFVVVFTEWAKPQEVTRTQLVLDSERADLRDIVADGVCELCGRDTPLTAHHLIPRQMHGRYLKKGYEQEFLNTCAMICRKCHNLVHRFKPNDVLAAEYSTIEKLLEAPFIQRWVAYAQKRPAPTKAERRAQLRLAK